MRIFPFCSTNKIKRLIDFDQFLYKWNNEQSQLEFSSRRNQFAFSVMKKIVYRLRERFIEVIFSVRELNLFIRKTFVHR